MVLSRLHRKSLPHPFQCQTCCLDATYPPAQPPFQVWNQLHELLTYNLIVIFWLPMIFALKILFLSSSVCPVAFSLLVVNCTSIIVHCTLYNNQQQKVELGKVICLVYVLYMIWHKGFQNCTFCCCQNRTIQKGVFHLRRKAFLKAYSRQAYNIIDQSAQGFHQ